MSTILPAIIAALATVAAAWVSRPRHAPSSASASAAAPSSAAPAGTMPVAPTGQAKSSFSLIFGAVGLIAWFIPIVGFPVTLVGLGFAVSHLAEPSRWRYTRTGIWLNVVTLMATTANSAIGSFMGYHGML